MISPCSGSSTDSHRHCRGTGNPWRAGLGSLTGSTQLVQPQDLQSYAMSLGEERCALKLGQATGRAASPPLWSRSRGEPQHLCQHRPSDHADVPLVTTHDVREAPLSPFHRGEIAWQGARTHTHPHHSQSPRSQSQAPGSPARACVGSPHPVLPRLAPALALDPRSPPPVLQPSSLRAKAPP